MTRRVPRFRLGSRSLRGAPRSTRCAGGGRKQADIKLIKKLSGLDASRGIIFHFYDPGTIQMLARLERSKSEQPIEKIQRTYFIVVKKGSGYEFAITKIIYK